MGASFLWRCSKLGWEGPLARLYRRSLRSFDGYGVEFRGGDSGAGYSIYRIRFINDGGGDISFNSLSSDIGVVPEPSSALRVGAGLAGLLSRRRARTAVQRHERMVVIRPDDEGGAGMPGACRRVPTE